MEKTKIIFLLRLLTLNDLLLVVLKCLNPVFQSKLTIRWYFPILYQEWSWSSTSSLFLWLFTSIKGKNTVLVPEKSWKDSYYIKMVIISHYKMLMLNNIPTSLLFLVVLANIPSRFSFPAKSFQQAEGKQRSPLTLQTENMTDRQTWHDTVWNMISSTVLIRNVKL